MITITIDGNASAKDHEAFACALALGEKVWVKITSGNRKGAIGLASPSEGTSYNVKRPWNGTAAYRDSSYNVLQFIDIKFDKGRGMKSWYTAHGVEWLVNYDGPVVYKSGIKARPEVKALDRLGKEIKVGDFGTCVLSHHIYNGPALYFARVIEVTKYGDVTVRSMPLLSDEEESEQKLNHTIDFAILDDTLMQTLMLKRLGS